MDGNVQICERIYAEAQRHCAECAPPLCTVPEMEKHYIILDALFYIEELHLQQQQCRWARLISLAGS